MGLIAGAVWGAAGKGTRKVIVVPIPTALNNDSEPCINLANLDEIDRPSPVPPYRRSVELSSWTNSPKIAAWRSGAMPMPVSPTEMATSPSTIATLSVIAPCSVNFAALPSRLRIIWRSRSPSPITILGTSSAISVRRSSPLRIAIGRISLAQLRARWRRSTRSCASVTCPASIFDRSRMSLSKRIIAAPDSAIICSFCCWSGRGSSASSKSVKPSTPFIGVRISWLILARKLDFAWAATSA
ncbi:hypothetical protein D9M73_123160 [compost metagenome]